MSVCGVKSHFFGVAVKVHINCKVEGGLAMKKKLLAFITAAMSLVFALSACNGDETTGGNGTHTHTYSEQWAYNDTDHWHACTGAECDEVDEVKTKPRILGITARLSLSRPARQRAKRPILVRYAARRKLKKLQQQTIPFLTNGKATTLTIGTSVSTATR